MTPAKAKQFRVEAKVIAQEMALDAICSVLRQNYEPTVLQRLADLLRVLQAGVPKKALEKKGYSLEEARLMDALYREALDEVLVRISEKLK